MFLQTCVCSRGEEVSGRDVYATPPPVLTSNGGYKRAVRILLECFLVGPSKREKLGVYKRMQLSEYLLFVFVGQRCAECGALWY